MTKHPSEEKLEPTKPCKVCAEKIKSAARICIHCSSYQDWRADLNISSTVLSLLVALVSVLTVAAPVMINALTPKNSKLAVSFQGANNQNMDILVSNGGSRPGTIRLPVSLAIATTKGSATIPLTFSGVISPAALLDPGKSQLLIFNIQDRRISGADATVTVPVLNNFDGDYEKATCTLKVTKTDFTGEKSELVVPIDCRELRSFISATQWESIGRQ
jgi:hypothetical protein